MDEKGNLKTISRTSLNDKGFFSRSNGDKFTDMMTK